MPLRHYIVMDCDRFRTAYSRNVKGVRVSGLQHSGNNCSVCSCHLCMSLRWLSTVGYAASAYNVCTLQTFWQLYNCQHAPHTLHRLGQGACFPEVARAGLGRHTSLHAQYCRIALCQSQPETNMALAVRILASPMLHIDCS